MHINVCYMLDVASIASEDALTQNLDFKAVISPLNFAF